MYSYGVNDGDSYAVVRRQLLWVLLGLPLAYVASRMSQRWVRRLAYPGFSVSLVLLLLTAFFGVDRNGNQNWLGVGPVADPALGDRQARPGHLGRARLRQQGPPARQPPPGDGPGGARAC